MAGRTYTTRERAASPSRHPSGDHAREDRSQPSRGVPWREPAVSRKREQRIEAQIALPEAFRGRKCLELLNKRARAMPIEVASAARVAGLGVVLAELME